MARYRSSAAGYPDLTSAKVNAQMNDLMIVRGTDDVYGEMFYTMTPYFYRRYFRPSHPDCVIVKASPIQNKEAR